MWGKLIKNRISGKHIYYMYIYYLLTRSFIFQAELTPSIFPQLYKQSRPFVISFVDDTETSREMLEPVQSLVQSGSFPDLIFCSLQWVLQQYIDSLISL